MYKPNIIGWEQLFGNMPSSYRKWFSAEKEFFIKNIKKNAYILEIGCGNGRSLNDLLPITKNLVGVDHDKDAVEHAKIAFRNFPSVKIYLADGKNLPFKSESFDYVICMTTFANFGEDKYKILEEMKRVLKKKGNIIISTYSEDALPERIKAYKKMQFEIKEIKDNGTIIFNDFDKEGISEQFSKKELIKIFNKSNLKIKEIVKVGIAYICFLSK